MDRPAAILADTRGQPTSKETKLTQAMFQERDQSPGTIV